MSEEDIKRHFDVTIERIEKRFDLVVEIVQHLDRKIDSVEQKTTSMDRKIDDLTVEMRTGFRELGARVDVSVAQLTDRISNLEQGQAALESRVARLEAALGQSS